MILGFVSVLIAALYGWTGKSPQRERIAAWSRRRAYGTWFGAWALAVLLDPDHGIVKQGPHMWIVGPIVWCLMIGGPVAFVRWRTIRGNTP